MCRYAAGRIPEKLDFNCDILEKKGEFLITADLPGLSKVRGGGETFISPELKSPNLLLSW
jgi:hypothetical protein